MCAGAPHPQGVGNVKGNVEGDFQGSDPNIMGKRYGDMSWGNLLFPKASPIMFPMVFVLPLPKPLDPPCCHGLLWGAHHVKRPRFALSRPASAETKTRTKNLQNMFAMQPVKGSTRLSWACLGPSWTILSLSWACLGLLGLSRTVLAPWNPTEHPGNHREASWKPLGPLPALADGLVAARPMPQNQTRIQGTPIPDPDQIRIGWELVGPKLVQKKYNPY